MQSQAERPSRGTVSPQPKENGHKKTTPVLIEWRLQVKTGREKGPSGEQENAPKGLPFYGVFWGNRALARLKKKKDKVGQGILTESSKLFLTMTDEPNTRRGGGRPAKVTK